jgi:hypothetical protein
MAEAGDEDFSGARNLWVLRHVAEKNGIYSNANISRSVHRNQKLFVEWMECLSSFHLNVLSMNSDVSSQRYRGLNLSSEKKILYSL